MNKLIKALVLFFLLYALASVSRAFLKENYIPSLILCIGYTVLFTLFKRRENISFPNVRKGATVLLFFLTAVSAVSLSVGILFPTDRVSPTLVSALISVFLIPISEELFYRATLYSLFEKTFSSNTAIFLSSLVFALAHAGLSGFITAFFAGVLLSLIYKREKSIFLPVLCHAVNNLLAVTVTVSQSLQPLSIVILVVLASFFFLLLRKDLLK